MDSYSTVQHAVTLDTNGTDANLHVEASQSGGGGGGDGGGGGGGGGGGVNFNPSQFGQAIADLVKNIPPWAIWALVGIMILVGVIGVVNSATSVIREHLQGS